jgi:hypothetical protein
MVNFQLKPFVVVRLLPLRCGKMPVWHYISGCPFPAECGRNKTTPVRKNLTFSGATKEAAIEVCVQHLMTSSLHQLSRALATAGAERMQLQCFEEDTDDESSATASALAERPRSPPAGRLRMPRAKPPPAPNVDEPRQKRGRVLALDNEPIGAARLRIAPQIAPQVRIEPQDSDVEADPLVSEISQQVSRLVAQSLGDLSIEAGSEAKRDASDAKREARRCIAEAEDAALKANAISLAAAQAFADVANKLNRCWHAMG